jgi:hypothetical protein
MYVCVWKGEKGSREREIERCERKERRGRCLVVSFFFFSHTYMMCVD